VEQKSTGQACADLDRQQAAHADDNAAGAEDGGEPRGRSLSNVKSHGTVRAAREDIEKEIIQRRADISSSNGRGGKKRTRSERSMGRRFPRIRSTRSKNSFLGMTGSIDVLVGLLEQC